MTFICGLAIILPIYAIQNQPMPEVEMFVRHSIGGYQLKLSVVHKAYPQIAHAKKTAKLFRDYKGLIRGNESTMRCTVHGMMSYFGTKSYVVILEIEHNCKV